jgi:mRNA-degrading endonuclease RelE of RelBE toxin-antitoxin system
VKVELSSQVVAFVRRQPPEPRRRLRSALKGLAKERGDVKRLEGPLEDYCRLRVGDCRVIVHYASDAMIQCVFVERRSLVYESFAVALREVLSRPPR